MQRSRTVIDGAELYPNNLPHRLNSMFSLLLRRLVGGDLEHAFKWFFFLFRHFVFTSFAKVMESRAAWNCLKPAQGETVCDLGCGGGANDVLLSLRGAKVFGVDIDRGSLFQAKRRASSLGVEANYAVAELGQSQFLCFKSGCFDKAVSYCVLEHLGYPEGLLEEVHRILRPGGTFILSVDSFSYRDVPRRFVELHRRFCSVRRYYTLKEAEVLLRDGNFHVQQSTFLIKSALASYFFRILLSYYFDSVTAGKSLRLRCFKVLTPIWFLVSAVSDLFWGDEQGGYLLVLHAAKEVPPSG